MTTDRRRSRSGPFAVECPACRAHLAVTRALVGHAARCPACRAAFAVPPAETVGRSATPPMHAPRVGPTVTRTPQPAARAEPASHDEPSSRAEPTPRVTEAPRPTAHEPLVFTEPPPPSTLRRRDEPEPAAADASPPGADIGAGASAAASAHDAVGPRTTLEDAPPAGATDGDLTFREPVKTIRSGGAEIELRRLTPEEKRVRRARRNLIILVVGAALLIALVTILGRGGR